jgi:polar amino acid transport system substrate-binding protein
MLQVGGLRRKVLMVAAVVLALAVAACGGEESSPATTVEASVSPPANVVSEGKITYGTAATFPPFEFRDGNDLAGFDIEMIDELAGYMGLETEAMDIEFDGLIPALNGRRVDVINSAMYIKPEREAQVDFLPYLVIGEAIIVRKGNEPGIQSTDDLAGKTVAVTRGAIGEQYMKEFNEQFKADGKPLINILTLPTNQDALLAVSNGRAEAFDTSTPGAADLLRKTDDEFEIATTFDNGTKIGLAFRKGDEQMRRALAEALERFESDGAYAKLIAKYNLPPETNLLAKGAGT